MFFCLALPALTIARPAVWAQDRVKAKPGHGNYSLVNGVLEEQKKGDILHSRITMPELTSHPKIDFPADQRKTGKNKVQLVIGVDGKTSDIRIVHSLRADYDKQTIASVQSDSFKPAALDGKPAPIQIEIEVHYSLR
jgi:TonB family protein